MVKPQLDLENAPDNWRGEIGWGFSENDWEKWFSSYTVQIVKYAQVSFKKFAK